MTAGQSQRERSRRRRSGPVSPETRILYTWTTTTTTTTREPIPTRQYSFHWFLYIIYIKILFFFFFSSIFHRARTGRLFPRSTATGTSRFFFFFITPKPGIGFIPPPPSLSSRAQFYLYNIFTTSYSAYSYRVEHRVHVCINIHTRARAHYNDMQEGRLTLGRKLGFYSRSGITVGSTHSGCPLQNIIMLPLVNIM